MIKPTGQVVNTVKTQQAQQLMSRQNVTDIRKLSKKDDIKESYFKQLVKKSGAFSGTQSGVKVKLAQGYINKIA